MNDHEKLMLSLKIMRNSSLGDMFWYVLLAFCMWVLFYVIFREQIRHRRISPIDPTSRQVAREIIYSLRSIAIFGLVAALTVYAACYGWTQLYFRVDDYGWVWFVLSIGLMILVHDAYFYWTHRTLHHAWLYRRFHHTHHLSTNPTPWAAYSFSPAEALIQAGIAPLVAVLFPVHPAAFGLFMVWQNVFNVLGHCGHEIFPRWFIRSPLAWISNSVTHHALHHEKFRSNFGLYFNFWDRMMGTNHPNYEQRFESITDAPPMNREESFGLPSGMPSRTIPPRSMNHIRH
ncbi:MAG: sterol desaturase family protein [Planctomycetaceae bacterium]|nr:sterol desaturase family protein [Planctomycetaceae bacterium]